MTVPEALELLVADLAQRLAPEVAAILAESQPGNGAQASSGGETWPEWMSVETAARYLDATPERVRKLKQAGAIPYYQDGAGARVFFRRAELDASMAALRQGGRAPAGAFGEETR